MVNLLVIFRGIHRVNFGALQLLTILRRQNFQTGPPVWVGRVSNGVASCYTDRRAILSSSTADRPIERGSGPCQ